MLFVRNFKKITKYLSSKKCIKNYKQQHKTLTIEDNVYCKNPVMFTMQWYYYIWMKGCGVKEDGGEWKDDQREK